MERINEEHVKGGPNEHYTPVVGKTMVGQYIALFVRKRLISRIKDVKTCKIKTGLEGFAGNKGAVALRFMLDDTSIVAVNCHLASGKNME